MYTVWWPAATTQQRGLQVRLHSKKEITLILKAANPYRRWKDKKQQELVDLVRRGMKRSYRAAAQMTCVFDFCWSSAVSHPWEPLVVLLHNREQILRKRSTITGQQLPSQQLIQEMMTWCLQEVIRETQTRRESRQRCTFPFKTCNSRNISGAFECLSHIAAVLHDFLTEEHLQCGCKYATLSHSKASKFAPLPAQLDIIGL